MNLLVPLLICLLSAAGPAAGQMTDTAALTGAATDSLLRLQERLRVAVESELVRDELIRPGGRYEIRIRQDRLIVNGKKQSAARLSKYLDLLSRMGSPVERYEIMHLRNY